MNKNEKGFSVIETVLAVLVVAVIGAVGWYVYKNHQSDASPKQTAHSTGSDASWKTYHWTAEGLTFKYPSSWATNSPPSWTKTNKQALSIQPRIQMDAQPPLKPSDPLVFLASPNASTQSGFSAGSDATDSDSFVGSFAVDASKDTADTITSASDAGSLQPTYVLKVTPFSMPGYKQLWIIEEGETSTAYADELAITDQPVTVGLTHSSLDDSFQSKTTPGDRISFTLGLFSEGKNSPWTFAFINMQKSSFEQLQDYSTALEIIKSINY